MQLLRYLHSIISRYDDQKHQERLKSFCIWNFGKIEDLKFRTLESVIKRIAFKYLSDLSMQWPR